jgi:hypothetical protein
MNPFELDEIEDAKIILLVKGKHYSILADKEKFTPEEARTFRVELTKVLLSMQAHIIVTPALEEINFNLLNQGKNPEQ